MEDGEKMKSNNLDYYQDKYKIIVRFNDTEPRVQREVVLLLTAIIVIGAGLLYIVVLKNIKSIPDMRDFLVTLIPLAIVVMLMHEPIHAIFLRFFSKQKPQVKINCTILRPNASVSRKEGIVSYLAPFLVLTILLIIITFLVKSIVQLAFITLIVANAAPCCQDFLFSFWLFNCNGSNIRLAHEKGKKGIDTIFFQG